MMPIRLIPCWLLLLTLIPVQNVAAVTSESQEVVPEFRTEPYIPILCPSLENLRDGDRLAIQVSGHYRVGPETSFLYDPTTPLCDLDVQPVVWVDFERGVQSEVLQQILRMDGVAGVTLRGFLEGPKPARPDRLDLPPHLSFLERSTGRRYGHLDGFRARIVVTDVIDAWRVPPQYSGNYVRHRPQEVPRPEVLSTVAPFYPRMAQAVSVEGIVLFLVEVEDGEVVRTKAVSGDRILVAAAKEVIESWKFDENFSGNFKSQFTYRLVARPVGADTAPIVKMQLPRRVEIIGARDLW